MKLKLGALIALPALAWFITFFCRGIWQGLWNKLITILNAFGFSTYLTPFGFNLFSISYILYGIVWVTCAIVYGALFFVLKKGKRDTYRWFLTWLAIFASMIAVEILIPQWFQLQWLF